jgi:hypothetical protein
MANFKIAAPQMGAPSPVSATGTVQQWPLGYVAKAIDYQTTATATATNCGVGEFVYAVGATAGAPQSAGQLVMFSGNSVMLAGTVNRLSNFPVGLAAGAISASNVYGWVQVKGVADNARISNHDVAAGASAFVASTTGLIATTQGAVGARIWGIHFPVSATSTQSLSVTVALNYPHMGPSSAL